MTNYTPSIVQTDKRCYMTGYEGNLDRHHIFRASRRKLSEKHGLWVWLKHDVHMALHDHRKPYDGLENYLKEVGQRAFEKNGGTREEFMQIFGCNYLD